MPGPLLIGALAGTGLGALKGLWEGHKQSEQQKKDILSNALATRFSPWVDPRYRQETQVTSGPLEGGMEGLGLGLQMGQNIQSMENQQALADAQSKFYGKMGDSYSNAAGVGRVANHGFQSGFTPPPSIWTPPTDAFYNPFMRT